MAIDFRQLPHPGIRSLISQNYAKPKQVLAHEKGIAELIKMASNENPLGCSPKALAAVQHMPSKMLATYPSPNNHPLKAKLAKKLKINDDQLFLSNGTDALFSLLLRVFALHRDKHILVHDYTFCSYALLAASFNIPVHSVAINADWQVNIDSMIKACSEQTSIVFIDNPSNPTGVLTSQKEIKKLLENIPESTLLVIDEAYFEFAKSQYSCNSISWLAEHPNLIITRTFSKIYGLAGLRLGYGIAHPELIDILQRVELPFAVNQAALTAGTAALDDEEFIKLSVQTSKAGMQQICECFDRLGIKYIPSACNFLTFDCGEDNTALNHYLLAKGIMVRSLAAYKMNQYLRLTIGTEEQNTCFIEALDSYTSETR